MAGLKELVATPAAGFEQPFEMLQACHERVTRMLDLLARLRSHMDSHGADEQARGAARDVMRYFDLAAPQHHLDEERHVLPALRASGDAQLHALAERLHDDHRRMEADWAAARAILSAIVEHRLDRLQDGDHAVLAGFASLYSGHIAAEEGTAFREAERRLDETAVRAMGADMRTRRGAT
jgi:hemerythrin-like domain-containing protein